MAKNEHGEFAVRVETVEPPTYLVSRVGNDFTVGS